MYVCTLMDMKTQDIITKPWCLDGFEYVCLIYQRFLTFIRVISL